MNRDKVKKQPDSSRKTGILPRSIGRIFNIIRTELSPQGERQYVRNFQFSKKRTRTSLKFLLVLLIVPIITHYVSKQVLVNPIVDKIRGENTLQIFLNKKMEDEALEELTTYQKQLRFQSLLHKAPSLSQDALQEKLKEKASELAKEFREKSNNSISNVFADLVSLTAFAVIVANSKREIAILKSFMDEIVYGISDSAKAFFIIMFSDIFVGYHSPDGWEVILEGFTEHLGLPPNKSVIFMFIATFPVILTSIFKYWIFNYLSKLSPSALATLKEMDE
ncbi:CemA family protein [Aetokthonos hydrillicola Thurmond2011]|jgi:hypothetical protein|uniref:Proton extrusion protein PxcA n=1 Tax=Aetokthonos hydrillicola Thurmond2011 TaxID=2712845 RepID=A0AAP5I767_9CYAN|nr:CemA family protein [Aetokthonos hydrillicola]MBO3457434.1 CemA family protein [Aetokthonos hydrillicola CCALA 1050]MBW4586044.1 CemA family protein [Aetokthonos hydrillicola CCALA 1050]MDR9893730.1 CemA family protein [Aetokthonos hydrillicola Thurmond2011]